MFSIVVPTLGRTDCVADLFQSIAFSATEHYEVIVVDQNKDNRLNIIISEAKKILKNVYHYQVEFKGSSKARNFGLTRCRGELVNFADDDAIFIGDVLSRVRCEFDENPDADMVTTRVLDTESDRDSMLSFANHRFDLIPNNIFGCSIEFAQFWRTASLRNLQGFDENLGVGTFFGAGEGLDLLVRASAMQYRMLYIPEVAFRHPTKSNAPLGRYFDYAKGTGRLTRKHILKPNVRKYASKWLVKGLVGSVIFLIKPRRAVGYVLRTAGFIVGFWHARGTF